MVEQFRRSKRKREQTLLGNHQKCWIWGRNVVVETLLAAKWPVLELYLADRLPTDQLERAQQLSAAAQTPLFVEPSEALTRRCRSAEHQGYLAKMPPYPFDDVDALLGKRPKCPLYVILDSIQDPYNFGAIVRSSEVMDVDAIFIGRNRQVEVTSQVARSSAGAVNHIQIAKVADLADLVRILGDRDVQIVGANEKAEMKVFDYNFRLPTAIVIGNEAGGIQNRLLQLCDQQVRIPQCGQVGSLNAAVSAGILLYEASRQRMQSS
jgi:23S rRNA (guanosine2251-2'-O)-methyltransferase